MIQGNFKKWNRITAGDCLTFPVNQQVFQILVLPLDTWNTSGLHGNVFGNEFSAFDSSHNHYQGIHHSTTPGATGSVHIGTATPLARDEDPNRGTIPMPTFARRLSTLSSLLLVEIPQNSMVGQQRRQLSELQFDKFPNPQSFLVWKKRFKKPSDYLF